MRKSILEKLFNKKPDFTHSFVDHSKSEYLGRMKNVKIKIEDGKAVLTAMVIVDKDKVKRFKKQFMKK